MLLPILFLGPAYYREGVFGVRLENILQVIEKPWLKHIEHSYYGFKTITYVPFEPNLIKLSLLSIHQVLKCYSFYIHSNIISMSIVFE